MKRFKHSLLAVEAIASLSAALALLSQVLYTQPASAQAAYGSYVGIGVSGGITQDDNSDGRGVSGVIAARYKLLETPISFRGQAFINSNSFAVVPTVSYDYPLNWQTDVYVGAGVAITGGDEPSPVGDKTSFAIQPGIDYALPNSKAVIFGSAIFAFDAYRDGGGTAISVQGGVGLRF